MAGQGGVSPTRPAHRTSLVRWSPPTNRPGAESRFVNPVLGLTRLLRKTPASPTMIYYTQILSLIFSAAMLTMWGRQVWKSSRRIEPLVNHAPAHSPRS